jgi:hypothetical protein
MTANLAIAPKNEKDQFGMCLFHSVAALIPAAGTVAQHFWL